MNDVKLRTKKGVWTLQKWKPAWLLYMIGLVAAILAGGGLIAWILWTATGLVADFVVFVAVCFGWL